MAGLYVNLLPLSPLFVAHESKVDAINVTYNLSTGGTTTINHGAQQGGSPHTVDISGDVSSYRKKISSNSERSFSR